MIGFTARAARQLQDLRQHFEYLERNEALKGLITAIGEAIEIIETQPGNGHPFPRPYPQLARAGRLWVKAGRYWVGYRLSRPPVIVAVFYDQADIPGHL
ncbi:type II toxin-antitoxin system RelE/ParE family toxin [Acidisoma silvae]|uniref:Type II toxin-antitoxin system RelE/ParE family toxin n=1 Tax=Acidisoma silvae TaxID=2802396 RepID=A0A964E018_9PROT|nr:type II toxin-antitoxin system RelE/ParE family toxin [Acidisoma silvae]MCB8876689.1 type II toxin-antitoxin system RelE/ParE family toxin [Acidisoma silvae]